MPLFRVPLNIPDGAVVRVRVAIDRPTLIRLRGARQAVPQAVDVVALLDTGAECSCVDPSVAARAALPIYGFGFASAPGTSIKPPSGFGGVGVNTRHTAGLTLLHPSGAVGQHLVVPDVIIQALPLNNLGYDALIGRDVLASCVVVYDGPAGSVTLAY
jgi:hypothetical protein